MYRWAQDYKREVLAFFFRTRSSVALFEISGEEMVMDCRTDEYSASLNELNGMV